MLNKNTNKGFTLIEIVIVLAIAALIMVVVFLAVQGAQRGQRDQARKDTLNRVISQAQSYAGNNGGTYPTAAAALATFCQQYLNGGSNTTGSPCVTINNTGYILSWEATASTVDGWSNTTCTFGSANSAMNIGQGTSGTLRGRLCLETNSYYVAP